MLILRRPVSRTGSPWEELLAFQLQVAGVALPAREYRFDPKRRWRFDFAWVPQALAVEVEGGIFAGGRHTRGVGFEADVDKYNAATLLGWRVLRFTERQIRSGQAVALIREALERSAAL